MVPKMTGPLQTKVFPKGGSLMGLAHDSPRQTTGVDCTTTLAPYGDARDRVRELLDRVLESEGGRQPVQLESGCRGPRACRGDLHARESMKEFETWHSSS